MLVSFIIPAYNSEDCILDAVSSALGQVGVETQVIVVNDGSTDGTESVLRQSGVFGRIEYVRKKNGGVASARNEAMSRVCGDYFCFLDSDDILEPDFSRKLAGLMIREKTEIAYCAATFVEEDGHTPVPGMDGHPAVDGAVAATIVRENFILTPTVLMSRSILGYPRFEESLRFNEDWLFWARVLVKERLASLDEPLVRVRTRASGLSAMKSAHGENYRMAIAFIEELFEGDDFLPEGVIAAARFRWAFNLLTYGMAEESTAYYGRAVSGGIGLRDRLSYQLKRMAIRTGLIGLSRAVKRRLRRERSA